MKQLPELNLRHVGDFVYELLDKRGMTRAEFCDLGNIAKATASRLFQHKSPEMGTKLYYKTCIILKLNEEERETLRRAAFPYEAVMEYVTENNLSPIEADLLFEQLKLPLLFSSKNDA